MGLKTIPYVYRTTFIDNFANKGGAIYSDSVQDCQGISCSFQDSYFENNLSEDGVGDEIYMLRSLKDFSIQNLVINNTKGSQLIYAQEVSLTVINITMIGNPSKFLKNGAAMQLWNCKFISISSSNFYNFSGLKGGALYFYETDSYRNQAQILRSQYNVTQHKITRTTFLNCSSDMGGALYVENSMTLNISNSSFINNQALNKLNLQYSGFGGAIYFTSLGAQNITQLYLDSGNLFENNRAELAGGVLFWDQYEPYVYSQNISLTKLNKVFNSEELSSFRLNNSARFYGNEFASYFQKLQFIPLNNSETSESSRLLEESEDVVELGEFEAYLKNFKSGNALQTFQIGITDIYNQIMTLDSTSTIQIVPNSSYNTDPDILQYPPVVEGLNIFQAVNGIITVESCYFYAAPGHNHSIEIVSKYIDLGKESSQELMEENELSDLSFRILIELRDCLLGEQFTPAGKCEVCKENTFAIEIQKEPGVCQKCPDQAICAGGYDISPKSDYWRESNLSTFFIKCPFDGACLGKQDQINQNGSPCNIGYKGFMCADCEPDYYKPMNKGCQKCPSMAVSIVKIIFAFVGWILLALFLVKVTYSRSNTREEGQDFYYKTLLNHIQLVMITTSINFVWAQDHIKNFFYGIRSAALINILFLRFECLIDFNELATSNLIISRQYYLVTIIVAILPFFVLALILIVWLLQIPLKNQSQFKDYKGLVVPLTVFSFLIHPSVIYRMSQNFNTLRINKEERLIMDTDINISSEEYNQASYYFAWPAFILWGLLLPSLAIFIIVKLKRRNLLSQSCQDNLQFFMSGYQKRYAYLEPAKMLLKAGILLIFILSQRLGDVIQGILFLTVYYMLFHFLFEYSPYTRSDFLILESSSVGVQILTIYFGLFLLTDKPEEWINQHQDQQNQSVPLGDWGRNIFINLTLVVNYAYFVLWIFLYLSQSKKLFSLRFSRSYLSLSQNFRNASIRKDAQEAQNIEEFNKEQFIHEFQMMTDQIRDLYSEKSLKVNSSNIKSLKQYLSKESVEKYLLMKQRIDSNENVQSSPEIKKDILKISRKFTFNKKKRAGFPKMKKGQQAKLDAQNSLQINFKNHQ